MQQQALATLKLHESKLVEALRHGKEAGDARNADNVKSLTILRTAAKAAAEGDIDLTFAANHLNAALTAAGFGKGTTGPYVGAYRGFYKATKDGVDIASYNRKEGQNGDAKVTPMTAPQAREYYQRATESPEAKAEREQREADAEVVNEAIKRLKAMRVADVQAMMDSGILPEVPAEPVQPTAVVKETAAERAARLAKEELERMEREAFGQQAADAGQARVQAAA